MAFFVPKALVSSSVCCVCSTPHFPNFLTFLVKVNLLALGMISWHVVQFLSLWQQLLTMVWSFEWRQVFFYLPCLVFYVLHIWFQGCVAPNCANVGLPSQVIPSMSHRRSLLGAVCLDSPTESCATLLSVCKAFTLLEGFWTFVTASAGSGGVGAISGS